MYVSLTESLSGASVLFLTSNLIQFLNVHISKCDNFFPSLDVCLPDVYTVCCVQSVMSRLVKCSKLVTETRYTLLYTWVTRYIPR